MWVSVVHGHSFHSFFFSLLLFDDPVCCWVMWLCIKCESFSVWTFHVQSSQCFVCVFRSNLSLLLSLSLARSCRHTFIHGLCSVLTYTLTNTRKRCLSRSFIMLLSCLHRGILVWACLYMFFIRPLLCCMHVCWLRVLSEETEKQQHQQQNGGMLLWNVIFIIYSCSTHTHASNLMLSHSLAQPTHRQMDCQWMSPSSSSCYAHFVHQRACTGRTNETFSYLYTHESWIRRWFPLQRAMRVFVYFPFEKFSIVKTQRNTCDLWIRNKSYAHQNKYYENHVYTLHIYFSLYWLITLSNEQSHMYEWNSMWSLCLKMCLLHLSVRLDECFISLFLIWFKSNSIGIFALLW